LADVFSREKRSAVMAAIRSKGNRETEAVLKQILVKAGVRGWRRHLDLPGRPDFSFPRSKLTIFVDGCFWHGCKKCYRAPAGNADYWKLKLVRNRRRDRQINRVLHDKGWRVIRIWQHSLRDPAAILRRIRKAIEVSPNEIQPITVHFRRSGRRSDASKIASKK
jgi:DNA mismatch endonuclease (patch repair protein)